MKDSESEARWVAFGKRVKDLRMALDATQKEIAKAAKITDVQLSRIENGESGTKRETIPRLANALRGDVSELYALAGFSGPISDDLDEAFAEEMIRLVRRVPSEQREIFKQKLRMDASWIYTLMTDSSAQNAA